MIPRVRFTTRLWLAWRVLTGVFTQASWETYTDAVTLTFADPAVMKRWRAEQ